MPTPSDLVYETATTTGTGNFTLTTVVGKRSFNTAFGTGVTLNVFDYFISNRSAAEWEIGTGHMSAATTLVRDTVVTSSNANALVNFSGGIKDIANDVPALKQVATDLAQLLFNKTGLWLGSYTAAPFINACLQIAGTSAEFSSMSLGRFENSANDGDFGWYKSRGSVVGTHAVVVVNDELGTFNWFASDGTAFAQACGVKCYVDDTPAAVNIPSRLQFNFVTSGVPSVRLLINSKGNVVVNSVALATNATDGFLYVPTCAGTPTGVPTTYTGTAPIVIDTTNNRLYFYSTGAWRNAGP